MASMSVIRTCRFLDFHVSPMVVGRNSGMSLSLRALLAVGVTGQRPAARAIIKVSLMPTTTANFTQLGAGSGGLHVSNGRRSGDSELDHGWLGPRGRPDDPRECDNMIAPP